MDEARYRELKEKMAALKSLYASRHYSQCAKFGELLLSEIHDQTHPLHLAHLNFYTALSHDTLAREATLKNRWKELSLAELHYNAAIVALSPLQSPAQCDPWSPTSSTTSPPSPYSQRRSSINSDRSAASSVTSLGDADAYQPSPKSTQKCEVRHVRNDSVVQTHESAQVPDAKNATTAPRPQTPQQFYFTANISSFVRMIEAHLADVRDQKHRSSVPTVRFNMPSPRPSPTKAKATWNRERRPTTVDDEEGEDAAMQAVRESRKNVTFRPRFDPSSTQKLCNEALAELIE
ncbi:hypothetical protein E8E12_010011 [Didymella heteroderae]|uniref:Uncharacterized protein n=1 Tax=Didymella heteroderae TaxID=1769908 RepID=A0A9P4X0B4_9PLEO|nr:hypothetical protein E8E12_010011 [Didymella heteroderae]